MDTDHSDVIETAGQSGIYCGWMRYGDADPELYRRNVLRCCNNYTGRLVPNLAINLEKN